MQAQNRGAVFPGGEGHLRAGQIAVGIGVQVAHDALAGESNQNGKSERDERRENCEEYGRYGQLIGVR